MLEGRFVRLAGLLACLDGYMNIAMEQTEVWILPCSVGVWIVFGSVVWMSSAWSD